MREIKFRVWDKVSKKYRKFDGMHDTMMMINKDGKVEYYNLQNGSGGDEYILEQFTGLHDATKWEDLTDAERDEWVKAGHTKEDWKGRRIFEGDVVLVEKFRKGVIRCLEKEALFAVDFSSHLLRLCDTTSDYIEIIGNIHDNEELLEEK
ncbi:MAG TPA: YopX family protein [Sphaerochaeta sp.]|nr:YopX family protein [Sphaerochaeta sp.]